MRVYLGFAFWFFRVTRKKPNLSTAYGSSVHESEIGRKGIK
jgi:hypothetical protein